MLEETLPLDRLAYCSDRFVLLSGCSGGGKSVLLSALRNRGFAAFEEPGRQVVREHLLIDGPALPWRDQALFAELCVSRAMQQMTAATESSGPVFFDRGIVDAVAFFEYLGRDVPAHLERAARVLRYRRTVFVTPPWPQIFLADRERRHSYEEAVAQYDASIATFRRLDYQPLELPKTSVESRADFILGRIG
ncbi:predicted ATPase [Rhizobium subbaraonis]|uniref:Predicted ATPase n=1 Tax=Rhizobium subbaraonis TaxID=908946 RepID=A0A285UGF1_9HYPH|nr:AAA family ATPase [Rhizobium subbaraonis]SOC40929.1 predicted ATPase [Rhizobium subbaraonis]